MMIKRVATIGPKEFSANCDKKKANEATVVIANAAKKKAQTYLQKISFSAI